MRAGRLWWHEPGRDCGSGGSPRRRAIAPHNRERDKDARPLSRSLKRRASRLRLGVSVCGAHLALALAVGCAPRGPSALEFPGAPLILISVDTLRADHLPAYGYAGVATPHLDALVRDSIRFENAYSHCPLTLPSHLSLLTGLLPAEHGVRNNIGYRFEGTTHKTLARILKGLGYATGGAVSAYVLRGATGISDSMDFFDDALGGPEGGDQDVSLVQRAGGETARRALAWAERVKSQPFFLFLHVYEPHTPYEPPEPFRSQYGPTYDGEIAASDAIVGEFLDALKRDGIYDRSIIVFVSDHGEGLGDHGEQEHGILLYREVLHVPLLLKLPGSREGGTSVREPVGLIDVLPTVTTLLKAAAPKSLQGSSVLARPQTRAGRAIYSETYYPRIHLGWSELRSLVDTRYHYIDGPSPELYEVVRDPGDRADVVSREATVALRMKAELDRYEERFAEPGRIDPEAAERLRALGYLAGTSPSAPVGEKLPNPKDHIHVSEELKAAFGLVRQGKDDEALDALDHVLKEDPGCFDAQRALAGTLARLGRYADAAQAYRRAMKLSPSLAASVALSLGQVELDMGKLEGAAQSAQAALNQEPGHAHQLLASVALARGDLAEAESQARRALADSREPSAVMVLARVYVRRSELPQALAVLEEAVPSAPGGRKGVPGFEYLRGDVLARLGRHSEAEAAFKEEIRSFPKDSQAYASLAVVVALEGRPRDEVRDVLESMVRANPTRETALQAAKTLEFVGDAEGANAWRHRAPPLRSAQRAIAP
jgi:choline-sulfatase